MLPNEPLEAGRHDIRGQAFRIGTFHVHPKRRLIVDARGREVRVDPKPMSVLMQLAQHAGEPVTRQELFDAVWPEMVVVEEALTRCVSDLRKAFGDTPGDSEVIETIRGVGYRLMQPVHQGAATLTKGSASRAGTVSRQWLVPTMGFVALAAVVLAGFALLRTPGVGNAAPPIVTTATVAPGVERFGDIARDGEALVYAASKEGRGFELFVQDSIRDTATRLALPALADSASSAVGPVWSDDQERIAFMRKFEDICDLVVVGIETRSSQIVGDCGGNYHGDLDWSPDDGLFAYSTTSQGRLPQRIVLSQAAGDSSRRYLTDGGVSHYGDHHPAFSPDGRRIAFVRSASEASADVYVVEIATGDVRRITSDERVTVGVDWINNDDVVYANNRSGQFQLWSVSTVDPDASPRWIPTGTENAYDPSVARDTGDIAFYHDHSTSEIVGIRQGARETLVSNNSRNVAPQLSPDGKSLAFVSSATGNTEVWLATADGENARPVTELEAFVDAPRWSPDGRRIAFSGSPRGDMDVFVLEVASGEVRRLTAHRADDGIPSWNRNGSRLLFASDRSGEWQIWSLPVDHPGMDAIPTGVTGFAVADAQAPDDAKLFVVRADTHGIWLEDRNRQHRELVTDELRDFDWGSWDATPTGLYYLHRGATSAAIKHIPRGSGSEDAVVVAELGLRSPWYVPWQTPTLDVVDDGSAMVVAQTVAAESEIMVVHPRRPSSRL